MLNLSRFTTSFFPVISQGAVAGKLASLSGSPKLASAANQRFKASGGHEPTKHEIKMLSNIVGDLRIAAQSLTIVANVIVGADKSKSNLPAVIKSELNDYDHIQDALNCTNVGC